MDPKVMREWLNRESVVLNDDALWKGKTRKEIRDQVLPVIAAHLDKPECARLEATAERVMLVADQAGQEAWNYMRSKLVEQLGAKPVDAIENGGNSYYRALKLFLVNAGVFGQVEGVRYADEWRGGKLYSGFLAPKGKAPCFDSPVKEDLESAVDALFGSAGEIVSESFEQRQELDDGSERTLFHFHIVHKGLEDNYETIEGREIVSKSIFPANHIRIVYLPDDGLLEIYAHQRNLRRELAKLFAIHILAESGDLELLPERRYALERLRDATPLSVDPVDALRIEAIDVMEVRFETGSKGSGFSVKRGAKDPRSLYSIVASQFIERDPFKCLNPITRVRVVIRLRKTGPTDPARKLPIVITMPNKCNIRHRCDSDQKLGEKYVRYWGLIVDDEEANDAVTAGLAHSAAPA
jgi:hypothetical protein